MSEKEERLLGLLDNLTKQLQCQGLWQVKSPSKVALASTLPFCCDTLRFEQWLQFIFIARLSVLVQENQPLPNKISVVPMAEEAFKATGQPSDVLLEILAAIDDLLSR